MKRRSRRRVPDTRRDAAATFWRSAASDASSGSAQIFAQNFSERIFRQRVDELNPLGSLEAREARAAELFEFGLDDLHSLARDDERLDDLPPFNGGHANHCAFV